MVAVAQYIPDDPEEQESVFAVLQEHPELRGFIQRAVQKAGGIFPELRVVLDSRHHDEFDPPIRLLLHVNESLAEFNEHYHGYARWLASEPDYPQDLILVMPLWDGPRRSEPA
jgi:hypothetical protein